METMILMFSIILASLFIIGSLYIVLTLKKEKINQNIIDKILKRLEEKNNLKNNL